MTEQELTQEARRILRLLAPNGRLARQKDGRWAVVRRGDPASRRLRLSAQLVESLQAPGWLVELPGGGLGLSSQGRSWLASQLAGIDPSAAQHKSLGLRLIADEAGNTDIVAVNEAESPIAWLKARGALTEAQFEAGEKLRRDYTLARLEPRLTVDLGAPRVQGRGPADPALMADTVLAAKQRFARALAAAGPGLSDLLFDVCCALKSVGAIETQRGWPRRSAKIVLGLGLDRLAEHYGLNPRPPSSRLRSWSAEFGEATHG